MLNGYSSSVKNAGTCASREGQSFVIPRSSLSDNLLFTLYNPDFCVLINFFVGREIRFFIVFAVIKIRKNVISYGYFSIGFFVDYQL